MKTIILTLFIFISLSQTRKELPSFMYPCVKTARDIDECFLQNGNMLLTNSADGEEDLGIPPLTSMYVSDLVTVEYPYANLSLHNITGYGYENMYIAFTNFDWQNKNIGIYFTCPGVTWVGEYDAHNNESDNEGTAHISFNNMGYVVFMSYELNNIDGQDYANITNSNTTFINPDIKIEFDNLDHPELQRDLQDNQPYFDQSPAVQDTCGNFSSKFLNYLFNSVPFDEIFID